MSKVRLFGPDIFLRRTRRSLSAFICVHLWLVSCLLFTLPGSTVAQIRPVYDQGALGLGRLLKRLNTSASVMMIGAHPDDEDTALLSYLARGENARTAYLSLTRGDGGQNIIGPELGEALGVIRTEELLQARKLDGAEQYFTRAYDFGFSKTLAEAKEKWDEKVILCDAVRMIRRFRPLVVVSQFSGTPADGHGQHQYAGYISPLAVKAAADAAQCSNAGPAWKVKKFYYRHRGSGEPKLRINTGRYDPLLGRSYFEVAMEARSQHRSQEQGVLELKGVQYSGLNLAGSDEKENGIFNGLDTTLTGVAANTENLDEADRQKLVELKQIAGAALSEYESISPEKILPHLLKGYAIAAQGSESGTAAAKQFFDEKLKEFASAIRLSAGIQIDALADRETVVPGETFPVRVKTFFALKDRTSVKDVEVIVPANWSVNDGEAPTENTQGFFRRETGDHAAYFNIGVAADAMPTQPYWLLRPRIGDIFSFSDNDDQRGLPLHASEPFARVAIDVLGTEVVFRQPFEYRYADDTRGELRRNVDVVPAVSVDLDQTLMVVPFSTKPQTRQVAVSVTNQSGRSVRGEVSLSVNATPAWKVSAASQAFELGKKGAKSTATFDVLIPAGTKPGAYEIGGNALVNGNIFSSTMRAIQYPHIQTHRIYRPAATTVRLFDLKAAPTRIGYIEGSGDRIPEAIRQMGFAVTMLDEKDLTSGDLSKFDTIVAGIRATETRPDLVSNFQRLFDFMRNGGNLIVQYQRPSAAVQSVFPFPAQLGPRVTDENAKVTILEPKHPIFNSPNKITDADFAGWVQERNLYNFSTMDGKYTGLLESHDANEPENKGGLVIADIGKGKYIYCSYSLFRQLPAGVPGAYRLLANMLSLRGTRVSN